MTPNDAELSETLNHVPGEAASAASASVSDNASVETLFAQQTPHAATRLQELAQTTDSKDVRKAARRALYLLSQKGIAPVETTIAALPPQSREAGASLRAWASAYDGAGNRLLFLIWPDLDGGSPVFVQTLIHDAEGVRDMETRRIGRRELAERLQGFEAQLEAGIALAEIEPDYGRFLIHQARALNQRNRSQTPAGFLDLLPRIGQPQRDYASSPIWEAITPEDIRNDAVTPHDPAALFALRWFEAWFLDVNDVAPWLRTVQDTMRRDDMTGEAKRQQAEDASREAAGALLAGDEKTRYVRRLEASADILLRRSHPAEARIALFHALDLRTKANAGDSAFAVTLVQRTFQVALEMMQAQSVSATPPRSQIE